MVHGSKTANSMARVIVSEIRHSCGREGEDPVRLVISTYMRKTAILSLSRNQPVTVVFVALHLLSD